MSRIIPPLIIKHPTPCCKVISLGWVGPLGCYVCTCGETKLDDRGLPMPGKTNFRSVVRKGRKKEPRLIPRIETPDPFVDPFEELF